MKQHGLYKLPDATAFNSIQESIPDLSALPDNRKPVGESLLVPAPETGKIVSVRNLSMRKPFNKLC